MQKIVPYLWFDKEARQAVEFYMTVFENAKITSSNILRDTPSGDVELINFRILGYDFSAISAGPYFKINPSISFHVRCRTVDEAVRIWSRLTPGGLVMMEFGEYPFSKRYGWIQDKFGVSWQVIYTEGEILQFILPALMFVGKVCGQAEEAIRLYTSVFRNTSSEVLARYEKGEDPDKEGSVKYAQFFLETQEFSAMDSALNHDFSFNEAVSFVVNCRDQKEIDDFWERLSAVPEAEQCGWIKDKFGVSWQIVPANMGELMAKKPEKTTPAMLGMKKIIIADLEKAGS